MKTHLYISLLTILLLLAGTFSVSAQIVDAEGQYVDTVFNDNVDRTAEDFVTVSLMIADPGSVFYTVLGHACLRLQCPTFGLDYCYSYESEDMTNRILDFLLGEIKMGLFAIPTNEYCNHYRGQGRGVQEYMLNLPPDVESCLWQVMDEHLTKGTSLTFDYFNRGCAITCVRFLNQALLGKAKIEYNPSIYEYSPTPCELVKENTKNALWVRFCWIFIVGEDVMKPLHGDKQLLIPSDLAEAWKEAKINGEPLILEDANILVEGTQKKTKNRFTPNLFALILLLLSLANLFRNQPYFDWAMLILQTALGVVLIYLMYFSNLCCTSWNWLLIPFNPLPAILWYWRKYWALPYVGILVIWCVAMIIMTIKRHVLVDSSHIMMVVAWIFIMINQRH